MGIVFNSKTGEFEEVPENDGLNNAMSQPEEIEISFTEKSPKRKYDERTGCFEYEDPELRQKAQERSKNNLTTDELQHRLDGLKKHLGRTGLDDDMGKTGNSSTGEISEQNRKVAKIQTEHAKEYILRSRNQR